MATVEAGGSGFGGGNTIATITFYGIWWFCHDPKRQQTRKQHNAQQERSNMDATATCDYEYNYHHQCHMSAEMRFSQCLTIGFLLVVVSCHCHKTKPYLPRCVFTAKPVNTLNWPKCFTKYPSTLESLKTTREPSLDLQSPNPTTSLHVTICGLPRNGIRMPTGL